MKKIVSILLLSLFLYGCTISIGNDVTIRIWEAIKIGNTYTFTLNYRDINEIRYYRIEQITEKEYVVKKVLDFEGIK